METVMERECSALGGLFQTVISDMKGSSPIWDDFINKASKLQSQLRTTVVAVAAFLDAFQKVADLATNSRGGTRDIGSALTRMCMRHRSIETKLRHFSTVFVDCLINPLQEQMEDWRRTANSLDKDHAKEYKKARQEIKKRSSDTLKLQKKAKKADLFVRGDLQPQLDSAMQDVTDKYQLLEETEKTAVRRALIEERGRFCCFVSMLRPIMEEEMSLFGEISHLQTLSEDLKTLTMDPHKLPASSEQVIVDLKTSDCSWSYQTPPSSPSSTVSRKSSMSSSVNSVSSSDSRSSGSRSPHFRFRSGSGLTQSCSVRLSSVSSHDSGFISHEGFPTKSPSTRAPDQDWSKAGLYDQPTVNTLRRRDRRETPDPSSHQGTDVTMGEEPKGRRSVTSTKQEDRDTHEELVQALARGLHLDVQGSSRDSLQGSSGYSSQTNTPCCSEDQQGSDCDSYSVSAESEVDPQTPDLDKSCTVPRNSDLCQSYRRMFQTKPASSVITPGVATIRRTPSSKPNLRRPSLGLNLGPIPIRPPMIPVKTPTVPEMNFQSSLKSGFGEGAGPEPPTPPPQPSARVEFERRSLLPELLEESENGEAEDYLTTIKRGIKLKKTTEINDRSAPFIH